MLTSFSITPVALPMCNLIAVGTMPIEVIIAYDELASASRTDVNAVHSKEMNDRWTQIEQHQQVATGGEKRMTHDWRQEIEIKHTIYGYLDKYLKRMKEIKAMRDCHLRWISIAKTWIGLKSKREEPGHFALYGARPKAREFEIMKLTEYWKWR